MCAHARSKMLIESVGKSFAQFYILVQSAENIESFTKRYLNNHHLTGYKSLQGI